MHLLTLLITFAAAVTAAPSSTAATRPATAATSSAIASAIRTARVLRAVTHVVALVLVQFPRAQDALPRRRQRRLFWRFRGSRGPRWWRGDRASGGLGSCALGTNQHSPGHSKE